MPKITKITYKPDKDRYWIYVDHKFCASVRSRTFPALHLHEGDEISCDRINELEKFHWKNSYGQKAWEKEKVRLERVKALIEGIDPKIEVVIVGFGATSTEFIAEHPEESGKPDIEVRTRDTHIVLLLVEVTGTETMRGTSYWVRPDKLAYASAHTEEDVWIILHYANPCEKFVFIKPVPGKSYVPSQIHSHDAIELYVEFSDNNEEVVLFDDFKRHIINNMHD